MNVNIFLRRFRISNSEIVGWIRCGDSSSIGTEKLRGLVKILPEPEDVKILAGFDGDRSKLGNAEKFYLELMTLPELVQLLWFDCGWYYHWHELEKPNSHMSSLMRNRGRGNQLNSLVLDVCSFSAVVQNPNGIEQNSGLQRSRFHCSIILIMARIWSVYIRQSWY